MVSNIILLVCQGKEKHVCIRNGQIVIQIQNIDLSRESVKTRQKVFKDVGEKVPPVVLFTEFTRTSVSLTLIAGGSHHELKFQSTGKLFFSGKWIFTHNKSRDN